MDGIHSEVTLAIGGAVGALCKFLMNSGLQGRWASWAAAVISLVVVGIYATSAGDFSRVTMWPYFLVWVETLTIAAGAFHLMNEGQKKFGTGDGRLPVVLLAVALGGLAVSGCALTAKHPTPAQQAAVRARTAEVIERLTLGMGIADQAVEAVRTSTLPPALKIEIGCDVLMAVGIDAPGAAVTSNCGPVPTRAKAPLHVAVKTAQDLTTCAARTRTVAVAIEATRPIWEKLERSGITLLQVLGGSLKFAIQPIPSCEGAIE